MRLCVYVYVCVYVRVMSFRRKTFLEVRCLCLHAFVCVCMHLRVYVCACVFVSMSCTKCPKFVSVVCVYACIAYTVSKFCHHVFVDVHMHVHV
jgi:hypothetical protein